MSALYLSISLGDGKQISTFLGQNKSTMVFLVKNDCQVTGTDGNRIEQTCRPGR